VVSLSHISDDLVQAGLDSATLITDTELRLRQGGIRVLNTTEALATPGAGVLVVIVTAGRRSNTRGWLLHIGTELHQRVRLERDPTVLTLAPTWRSQGVTATDDDVARIRQIVRDHVDQFVNAWLAANRPK